MGKQFFHLDFSSGGKSFFHRPEFWVLEEKSKTMYGPFESQAEAKDYIGFRGFWPTPRVIQGVTQYGLGSRDFTDSLSDEWTRRQPIDLPGWLKRQEKKEREAAQRRAERRKENQK